MVAVVSSSGSCSQCTRDFPFHDLNYFQWWIKPNVDKLSLWVCQNRSGPPWTLLFWTTYAAGSCSLPSSCEIWGLPIISRFAVASRGADALHSGLLRASHTIIRLTTQTQTTTEQVVGLSANSALDVLHRNTVMSWSKWDVRHGPNEGIIWCPATIKD